VRKRPPLPGESIAFLPGGPFPPAERECSRASAEFAGVGFDLPAKVSAGALLPASDARPHVLCPLRLRKPQWNRGFDVAARCRRTRESLGARGFGAETAWLPDRLREMEWGGHAMSRHAAEVRSGCRRRDPGGAGDRVRTSPPHADPDGIRLSA
jgi:hypothetical protein